MRKRQLTLLGALLLSLLLHVFVIGGGEFALPDFYSLPDEVLESRKPGKVQQVTLAKAPRAKPAGIQFVQAAPKKKSAAKKKKEKAPEPAPEEVTPAEETSAAEVPADAEAPVAETPEPVKPEPPPPFPIQVEAVVEVRYNGIPVTARQHWVMEGFRYAITQTAKKFGISLQISSEGRINPEGGLSPEQYQFKFNDKLRSSCSYKDGEIHYGKTSSPKSGPLPFPPQDMASLPFHVAVTFNGQPQSLYVCTGNSVSQVRLTALAEEKIKLPAGTLRTLHLTGERYDEREGKVIKGYEVWLALDYFNYPVKFIGQTNSGDRVEFRVQALELEGQVVLGDKGEAADLDEGEVPEWIRERSQQEGLNNP
ncbi:MAG TPA: DUF3108 domain-containing protein [Moraxellaceae bacterium]